MKLYAVQIKHGKGWRTLAGQFEFLGTAQNWASELNCRYRILLNGRPI